MDDLDLQQELIQARIVGTGTRVLNFLVDFPIICLITFGVYRGWTFYVVYWGFTFIPSYDFLAIITFIYYLFFEAIWKRTPGKRVSLTRVVNQQGGKPSFGQIVIRTAVRIVGIIIIDSLFLSFANKTLHDLASKTEVVEV